MPHSSSKLQDGLLKLATEPYPDDLITDWFQHTEHTSDFRSPDIFRRWAGIALVAGAIERRIWVTTGAWVTYLNLYLLLVGSPGAGKQIINTVRGLWNDTLRPDTKIPAFKVAPDNMTKAALVDTLAKATQVFLTPAGTTYQYHSLLISSEEFSVLMPDYNQEYVGALNSIYNCPKMPYMESRRFGTKEVSIELPQLNILGGIQPELMNSLFPQEIWGTGLGRRLIMIYSSERKVLDPFALGEDSTPGYNRLLRRLGELSQIYGPITWTPEAAEFFKNWVIVEGEAPVPTHSKLSSYSRNRQMNIIKLAGISAISRGVRPPGAIALIDVKRALEWLLDAERAMPDIFRAMIGKSDWQVIEELYLFVMNVYNRNGRKPFKGDLMYQFVGERAPSDKVRGIIELAVRSNIVECVDQTSDTWKPRPKFMINKE